MQNRIQEDKCRIQETYQETSLCIEVDGVTNIDYVSEYGKMLDLFWDIVTKAW